MDSIYFAGIAEVAGKIRAKEISPREIIDAHLARIEKLQPKLNAFVHVDAEGARRQGLAAEASVLRGDSVGALHGVPISIKSCIDVAGWPCPAGSRLRTDYVAGEDAVLVSRLRAAGAILIGNTNVPEFLMAYETDNALSGKTNNPWELARSAGGSSGGEAAAIASGCSMGGVGSDGGGSVRVPAHFCGISGLKPTPGRIPGTGHFPREAGAFPWLGVVGPMARTVVDVRVLFDVMKGLDADDALSTAIEARSFGEGELTGMRVGLLESDALGSVTRETREAVDRAASLLSEQFQVEPLQLKGLERAIELWWFFFGPMIARLFEPMVEGREVELSLMFREYLAAARLKTELTVDQFMGACVKRDIVRANIIKQMRDVPILLSPVCAAPAFRHGEGNWQPGCGYRDTMRHAQWLNLAGFPGVSVPMGFSAEGLPIGVQVIGRPNEDELILAVAEMLETARGKFKPPTSV
ncbi:MAG TPA: amidase [Verrucomicrobiae bacterium]|jgi:Asp-tRNA(Asn)/Glu-tRNA(Gln) amidotransferase A subunit family amidase|nr:amidase [Verrucomicrobiae bacterium]